MAREDSIPLAKDMSRRLLLSRLATADVQLGFSWVIFTVVSIMYLAPPVLAGLIADDLHVDPGDVSMLPTVNAFTQVVLSMPAGSAVQSVVAEYLNELLSRARAIAAEVQ